MEVVNFARTNNYDLLLIQEPYFFNNSLLGLPPSWRTFYDNQDPRSIIIVNNKHLMCFPVFLSRDIVIVQIGTAMCKWLMISVYFEFACSSLNSYLSIIENYIRKYPRNKIVLAGDVNAKNSIWGSSITDHKGTQLADFSASHNFLFCNNVDCGPTYRRGDTSSSIDVTMVSSSAYSLVSNWLVHPDHYEDHFMITYEFHEKLTGLYQQHRYNHRFYRHSILRTFPSEFSDLTDSFNTCTSEADLNEIYESFENRLHSFCDRTFKRKTITAYGNTSWRWWTTTLELKRKQVRACRRRWQRSSPTNKFSNLQKFRLASAEYKNLIIATKKRSWLKFCEKVHDTDVYGTPYKIAFGKTYTPFSIGSLTHDNITTSNSRESLELIIKVLFPGDNPAEDSPQQSLRRFSSLVSPTTNPDRDLQDSEIKYVMKTSRNGKAPGPDGFTYELIRILFSIYPDIFNSIFRCCFVLQCFPANWKVAELILFSKKDRIANSPHSYRPICLLNCLAKLMEKLIYHRFQYFLHNHNVISDRQFGFMPQRSTIKALHTAIQRISAASSQNKYSIAISFDIKNAFNSLWWVSVLTALQSCAAPTNLFNLIANYFSNRKLTMHYYDISLSHTIERGCPQGSILGPLLWNLGFNSIFQCKFPENCHIQAFADDVLIIISDSTRKNLVSSGQKVLRLLLDWSADNKLNFDQTKTQALLFGGVRKRLTTRPSISYGNFSIKFCNSMKVLGIMLDDRFHWGPHIEYISNKAKNRILRLRRLCSRHGGLNSHLIKNLFVSCVEKIVSYGSSIWYKEFKDKRKNKIESIQRGALLLISKAYRSTSTAALQVITGSPPLLLRLRMSAIKEKLTQLQLACSINGSRFSPLDFTAKCSIYNVHPASWKGIEWTHWNDSDSDMASFSDNTILIFTDGSCTNEGTGAGFIVMSPSYILEKHSFSISKHNSIFQAEMVAILKALQWISHHNSIDSVINDFFIISDAMQVLRALQKAVSNDPTVHSIQKIHVSLHLKGLNVYFKWVKSHSNILGNELADELAKSAAQYSADSHSQIATIPVPLPISFLNRLLKEECLLLWDEEWSHSTKGRFTYNLNIHPSYKIISSNSWHSQIITGHSQCPALLCKLNIRNSDLCRCGYVGDTTHYLYHCPITESFRADCPKTFPSTPDLLLHVKDKDYFRTFKNILDYMEQMIETI